MNASAPAEARYSTVNVAGEPLHVMEVGEGPPVLLVHGLNASLHVFEPLCARAASRYRFLAVDLPCSGKSGRYSEFDPEKLAEALAALLRERKLAPAVVVGHSFGGVVAMELTARYPKLVRGLVVLAAPALGLGRVGPLLSLPLAEQLWSRTSRMWRSPRLVRAWLRTIRGSREGLTDELVARYMEAMAHEHHPAVTLEALRSLARYHLPVEGLRASGVPRAVLWGDKDRLVPILQGEQVAHALEVPLTILYDAGHCLPEECPDAVETAIAGLAGNGRRAAASRSEREPAARRSRRSAH